MKMMRGVDVSVNVRTIGRVELQDFSTLEETSAMALKLRSGFLW